MHLGLWHLLSCLAGFHPSALSVCSKLRLSVSCVTSSPQLRGFSPPPQKTLTHLTPKIESGFHFLLLVLIQAPLCGMPFNSRWEQSHLIHVFISSVYSRARYIPSTQGCSSTSRLAVWALLWLCPPYLVGGWFLYLILPVKWFLYLALPAKWFLYLTVRIKCYVVLLVMCLFSM